MKAQGDDPPSVGTARHGSSDSGRARGSSRAETVWRRTVGLADVFEQRNLFVVVLELLRSARYDLTTLSEARLLGQAWVRDNATDLAAARSVAMLDRAVAFLGGGTGYGAGATARSTKDHSHNLRQKEIRA